MVTALHMRDSSSTCYFSISPPLYNHLSHEHFSVETPGIISLPNFSPSDVPSAYPNNPLLAQREVVYSPGPASQTIMSASGSNLLQLQTAAANVMIPTRPRTKPTQNVFQVTSDDSRSSCSSDSSSSSLSSMPDTARCSRCQRTPSIDIRTGSSNMVQYGLNLYYCSRCAAIVGLVNR